MSRQKRRDTGPEMRLRRALHALGYRYRVDLPIQGMVRRRADLTFSRARVAVFVDGCFWHGCPRHGAQPDRNQAWWAAKLRRNFERDRETDEYLRGIGWIPVRIWEHEPLDSALAKVTSALLAAGDQRARTDGGRP